MRQSEGILSEWGGSSLIAAKFLPGISVVAAPMAGALGMSWARFVAYAIDASLSWSIVFRRSVRPSPARWRRCWTS